VTFDEIIAAVETELKFARDKFPSNKHLLHAFTEEAGEVTKAFLDNAVGKCESSHIRKELVQAIAMAVRLLQEGDPDFPNLPTMQPPENSCWRKWDSSASVARDGTYNFGVCRHAITGLSFCYLDV